MSIKKLLLNGAAIFGATLIVCGMSFTTFAAEEGADAAAQDTVPQEGVTPDGSMGYDVQSYGFNTYGFTSDGQQIQSTFSNDGYATYVDSASSSSRVGNNGFQYGTPYNVNGLETTITPNVTDNSVIMNYNMTNVSGEDRTFNVGSNADTQIGRNDRATIVGDGTGVTMYDNEGAGIILLPGDDSPFDHLWFGNYGSRNANTFTMDAGVQTGELSGVDSGVAWAWSLNLTAGESAARSVSFRIGENIRPTPTPATNVPEEYVQSGPRTPDAPRIWCALTEKGNALPIQNMGIADAQTYTLFIDISGATALQYKDVIKQHYANAPAGGVFVLGTSQVSTFDKEICETLESRKDVTIKMVFPHEDHVYQITIPAGSEISPALDDNGFAGFLKIGSVFGMTQIG